ncbi:hypothetical protein GCM10028798_05100 [Humibacter antri]
MPGASPDVIRAAAIGTRLTCVTEAHRRKLWTFSDARLHVAAPEGYSAHHPKSDDIITHWSQGPVPIVRDVAVEPLANVLFHIARCQPLDYAVATFDSALNSKAIAPQELRRLAAVVGGRFAAVVAASDGRADSGGETLFRVRMAAVGVHVEPQVVIDGHPVDGLIGKSLVIQVDGFGPHQDPKRRARDLAQDRRLNLRGCTVFRYSSWGVENQWQQVEHEVLGAIAQGLHER